MLNFEYQNKTKIIFGRNQLTQISKEIPSDARILLTFGSERIRISGLLDQIKKCLGSRVIFEFSGIQPNPDYDHLMKAVNFIHKERITYLLAIGGGSVIDGTKFIAAATYWELGDPWEIVLHQGKGLRHALPLGCIVTLPATGSEANPHAVISRSVRQISLPSAGGFQASSGAFSMQQQAEHEKLEFSNPMVQPQFAVLDPLLTYSLTQEQVGFAIIDAFTHVLEQYLTYPVGANLQDRIAESILETLLNDGMYSFQHLNDYQSRSNLMWASSLALNGLIGAGVPQDWSTHLIGHELTALFDIPHAQSLAVILPALLTHKAHQKKEKLMQLGQRVWHLKYEDSEHLIAETINQIATLFRKLGASTQLSELGIFEESIPLIIERLKKHHAVGIGEHQNMSLEECYKILIAAL